MTLTIHEQIDALREENAPVEPLTTVRDYARGLQGNTLTTEQKEILTGLLSHRFADNVSHQIIAEANGRINLEGWVCESEAVQDFLSSRYTTLAVQSLQQEIHYDSLRDGNHCVAVAWDPVRLRLKLHREAWWDGSEGIFLVYDEEDEPLYAVKDWTTEIEGETVSRRIIWYPDRIERYIEGEMGSSRDGWTRYTLNSDRLFPEGPLVWPMPWLTIDGEPLGIPYVHFPNSGRGTQNYGVSELSGGVLAFQDMINDIQMQLASAGRLTAFQMLWIAGIELATDADTGLEIPPKVGPGQMFHSRNTETKFGVIPAGDISQLISLYNNTLRSTARISRTPLHAITGGDWPSGEALLRAEQPAIGKASMQINRYEVSWTQVAHLMVKLWNRFSRGTRLDESPDTALIGTRFSSPERTNFPSRVAIVGQLREWISRKEGLRILGYSDEDALRIEEERNEEQRESSENFARQFDAGRGIGIDISDEEEDDSSESA